MMPFLIIFAAMTAIAATVLLCIFVMPEKKAAKLPKFVRIIRDILDMKELYLEKVLKVLYIAATLFCVIAGAFMLFGFTNYGYHVTWYGGYGLLLMIGGPIVLRLIFEGLMMFVLLVKNTMQINNKLKAQDAPAEEKAEEPAPAPEKSGVVIVQTHEQ